MAEGQQSDRKTLTEEKDSDTRTLDSNKRESGQKDRGQDSSIQKGQ